MVRCSLCLSFVFLLSEWKREDKERAERRIKSSREEKKDICFEQRGRRPPFLFNLNRMNIDLAIHCRLSFRFHWSHVSHLLDESKSSTRRSARSRFAVDWLDETKLDYLLHLRSRRVEENPREIQWSRAKSFSLSNNRTNRRRERTNSRLQCSFPFGRRPPRRSVRLDNSTMDDQLVSIQRRWVAQSNGVFVRRSRPDSMFDGRRTNPVDRRTIERVFERLPSREAVRTFDRLIFRFRKCRNKKHGQIFWEGRNESILVRRKPRESRYTSADRWFCDRRVEAFDRRRGRRKLERSSRLQLSFVAQLVPIEILVALSSAGSSTTKPSEQCLQHAEQRSICIVSWKKIRHFSFSCDNKIELGFFSFVDKDSSLHRRRRFDENELLSRSFCTSRKSSFVSRWSQKLISQRIDFQEETFRQVVRRVQDDTTDHYVSARHRIPSSLRRKIQLPRRTHGLIGTDLPNEMFNEFVFALNFSSFFLSERKHGTWPSTRSNVSRSSVQQWI